MTAAESRGWPIRTATSIRASIRSISWSPSLLQVFLTDPSGVTLELNFAT